MKEPNSPVGVVKIERIAAIDAARGLAMVLVCLSHFLWAYFWFPGRSEYLPWFADVTLLASPTFMVISGMMLGLLNRTAGPRFRVVLVDRGLFLLTVAHALILISHQVGPGEGPSLRWLFITDAIGFAIIVGPWLTLLVSTRARVLIGLLIYAAAWWAALVWQPNDSILRVVRDTMAGTMGDSVWNHSFPLLPWFAIYLCSTALGEHLAAAAGRGELHGFRRRLLWLGLGGAGTAVLIRLTFKFVTAWHGRSIEWLDVSTSVWQKWPPSPAYFLFFGGGGLLMTWLVFAIEPFDQRRLLNVLRLVGRNSLFVFVLQFFVYFVGMVFWVWPYSTLWPVEFAFSFGIILLLTLMWNAAGGNRFLTVGVTALYERRTQSRST